MEMGDLQSIVWHSSLRAISRSRRNASASRRLTSPRLASSSRLSSLIAGRRELETREPAQKELRDNTFIASLPRAAAHSRRVAAAAAPAALSPLAL